jgi:hypothetical protein
MTLEDFVTRRGEMAQARGISQDVANQAKLREAQREFIENYLPSETVAKIDFNNPEELALALSEGMQQNQREDVRDFTQNKTEYVRALPEEKLTRGVFEIEPVKRGGSDDCHYDLHEEAYDLIQTIAKAEQGDAASLDKLTGDEKYAKAAKRYVVESAKKAIAPHIKKAQDETKAKILGRPYATAEDAERWANFVGQIEQARSLQRMIEKYEKDVERDPTLGARKYLSELRQQFYEHFPDAASRDHNIANYARRTILSHASKGEEGIGKAISYVAAFGKKD